MSDDKKIDIHIATTADTSGVDEADKSLKKLKGNSGSDGSRFDTKGARRYTKTLGGLKKRAAGLAISIGRGAGLYGVIQLVNKGLQALGEKANETGDLLLNMSKDTEQTNRTQSKLAGLLGKSSKAFSASTQFINKILNPLGAYREALNKANAAKARGIQLDRQIRAQIRDLNEAREKQEALTKANEAYAESSKRNAEFAKAFADALRKGNDQLDHRLDKLRALADAKVAGVDAGEEARLADIEGDSSLTDAQKKKKSFQVREEAQRTRFKIREEEDLAISEAAAKEKNLNKRSINKKVDEVNRFENFNRDVLSENDLKGATKKQREKSNEALGQSGFDSVKGDTKKDLLEKIRSEKEAIENLRQNNSEIDQSEEVRGIRRGTRTNIEKSRRDNTVAREKNRRAEERDQDKKKRIEEEPKAEDVAEKALKLGRDSGVNNAAFIKKYELALAGLADGDQGGEIKAMMKLVETMYKAIEKRSGGQTSNTARIRQMEAKLQTLGGQVKNNR